MKTIEVLTQGRRMLKSEIQDQLSKIAEIENDIAAIAFSDSGHFVGERVMEGHKEMVVTGYKFMNFAPYYRLMGARIKKNGDPYNESRSIFVWWTPKNAENKN